MTPSLFIGTSNISMYFRHSDYLVCVCVHVCVCACACMCLYVMLQYWFLCRISVDDLELGPSHEVIPPEDI